MASKIRTQARDAVIAAEQRAATVEMERDVAREEAAELRRQLAFDHPVPLTDTSHLLLQILRELGDEYGPAGVASAATQLARGTA